MLDVKDVCISKVHHQLIIIKVDNFSLRKCQGWLLAVL